MTDDLLRPAPEPDVAADSAGPPAELLVRPDAAAPAAETARGNEGEPAPARARDEDLAATIDRALAEQALGGELEAFNQLVRRHQDHLFALVYRLVPDRDQAADAVQEAFFSAYRNLGSFRGGSFRSWLSKIAVNAALDLQRTRRRRPSQPYPELEDESWQPPAGEDVEPDVRAVGAERARVLADALAKIGEDQRTAIVLYDVQGYDYAEIAEMTGVEVGTVKSRIHRGRLALRTLLAPSRELFRG